MIGNIGQFWRLIRELDVNAIRADFEHPTSLWLLGSDSASAERVARMIAQDAIGSEVLVDTLDAWAARGREWRQVPDAYVIVIAGPLEPAGRRALADLSIGDIPLQVVQIGQGADVVVLGVPEERVLVADAGASDEVVGSLVLDALARLAPDAMLPLGRRYPRIREALAERLIRDTARANAQFAALSSLPANVPLFGGMVGNFADMLVLTKNQLILLFKLAGLYGRDLELRRQLVLEILPVVGGAFFWRSAARSLVGLMPGFMALLPKVVVAYAGTFLVGEMARYYYRYGRKPPPGLVRELSEEGLRLARNTLGRLKGRV